jgi:N-methylhydantoinase B/oxoprolinase/acetone carboxylase alpha subunit
MFGGEASAVNRLFKNGRDLAASGALMSGEIVLASADDTFTSIVPGGGGYGLPSERDPLARDADRVAGLTLPPTTG